MSLLNVGARALLANQIALQTTGNNIANASTVGYSRQTAVMGSVPGQFTGSGYIGKGETPVKAEDRLAVLDSVRRKALLRDARAREDAREAERQKRKAELERLRLQEEEAARQAARTTHED